MLVWRKSATKYHRQITVFTKNKKAQTMFNTHEIYLDENATTRVQPAAAKAAQQVMEESYGNPSSSHITGLRAKQLLEKTRNLASKILNANNHNVIFTSGATEAIQTAILSTLHHLQKTRTQTSDTPRLLLYSATEHKAVPQALKHWNDVLQIGNEVRAIPVDSNGQLDLDFIKQHAPNADMICTMAVNNETGVITNLNQIDSLIRQQPNHILWLADCVQALGKLPIDLTELSIDYVALSGHKVYAPKGIGMLIANKNAPLTPLIAGGGQEQGLRSGTENLPGVAALGAILNEYVTKENNTFRTHDQLIKFRLAFINSLTKAFPRIVLNTPINCAVPTTINFCVDGFTSKEIMDLFDAADLRVSSGSACGSALVASYVLEAMGLPQWQTEGAIRLSFGPAITQAQVDAACKRIEDAGNSLAASCLSISATHNLDFPQTMNGIIQLKKGSMCSWILYDEPTKNCIIIDPFDEFLERIQMFVQCKKANVLAVLDTHGHVDHKSPRPLLIEMLKDYTTADAVNANYLGWPENPSGTVQLAQDNSTAQYIRFTQNQILVGTDLPGHTKDHQGYLLGYNKNEKQFTPQNVKFAILGDLIQIGGIGRSDFPASTPEVLLQTLRRLPNLIQEHTIICPTHDYSNGFATTLAAELKDNPFLIKTLDTLLPITLEDFLHEKKQIDAQITDATNCELVCGRIQHADPDASQIIVKPDQLKKFFQEHKTATLIDVREPHEFSFTQNWSSYGLETPPENIPLTRFSNFLERALAKENPIGDIILLCRSGNRSGKAAQVLRRLGKKNVWNIAGGIALSNATQEPDTELCYTI